MPSYTLAPADLASSARIAVHRALSQLPILKECFAHTPSIHSRVITAQGKGLRTFLGRSPELLSKLEEAVRVYAGFNLYSEDSFEAFLQSTLDRAIFVQSLIRSVFRRPGSSTPLL